MTYTARLFVALLAVVMMGASDTAYAQDLGDLLGDEPESSSSSGESDIGRERRELENETDVEASTKKVELPDAKKKVIKVLQRKPFLKLGRVEAMPFVGIITNEPFIRRIQFGAGLGYHLTDIFQLEIQGSFMPNFGRGDWKSITTQVFEENRVNPEISRMLWHATANLNYSVFYGKVASVGENSIIFDIYGSLGVGATGTQDDLALLDLTEDALATATQNQVHPMVSYGAGIRVAFTKTVALRFEGRGMTFINTFESLRLELKNNIALSTGVSFFFGKGAK